MDRRDRPLAPWIATAVWGILIFPGLVGAVLSSMFFDAPGAMNNRTAWMNALIVISFPCLCIVSIAGSWIVWHWHKRWPKRLASYLPTAVACLPLIPITYVLAVLVVGFVEVLVSGQPMGVHSTIIHPLHSRPSPRPYPRSRL